MKKKNILCYIGLHNYITIRTFNTDGWELKLLKCTKCNKIKQSVKTII